MIKYIFLMKLQKKYLHKNLRGCMKIKLFAISQFRSLLFSLLFRTLAEYFELKNTLQIEEIKFTDDLERKRERKAKKKVHMCWICLKAFKLQIFALEWRSLILFDVTQMKIRTRLKMIPQLIYFQRSMFNSNTFLFLT